MPLLECLDLTLGYEGKTVVAGLSFSVNSGDYLCIAGENGSGKSTLMKAILGLKPPMSGRIAAGEGLGKGDTGYLPQQTAAQKDFPASVSEIVLSGCLNKRGLRPFYNKEEKNAAALYMDRLDISNLSKRCYRELSGGQQQRTLLARALCSADKLLVMDEPAAGLDPKASDRMYEITRGLNKTGMTIIMVSHDIHAAVKYASHILCLGKKFFFGSKNGFLESDIGKAYVLTEEHND